MRVRGPLLRRLSAVCLLLAMLAALTIPAAAGPHDRLDQIERRRQQIERKQGELAVKEKSLSAAVRELDVQAAAAETEVRSLDRRLSRLDADIEEVTARLTRAQVRLALVQDELTQLQGRLVKRTNVFTDRAVAAYKAGPTAYLDGMLSSETFSDLLDRFAYYESALNADSQLVEQIEVLRDATAEHRDLVEEKKDEIALARGELEHRRGEVAAVRSQKAAVLAARRSALDQKERMLAGVRANRAQLRRIADQLARESSQIEAILAASASTGGAFPSGGGRLAWPAAGPVTSGYGYRTHPIFGDRRFHSGIDIGAPHGAPVVTGAQGTVVYVGTMSGYGNVVAVAHGGSLATTYNHLSAFTVSRGQSVSRGQQVGSVGCTGYCTGPHLHFEVRVNGSPVDPMPYLR